MKISVLCLPIALCFSLVNAVGLDGNLAITTASGRLQPIRDLKVGDEVVCYSKDLQQQTSTIKGICEITVDSTVAITTADAITLNASPTERFYLPKENAWVCAKSLKEGDCLLNEDLDTIAITKVEQLDGAQQLFVITVDKHHNFLASEGKYLVHNGPVVGWYVYLFTKGLCLAGVTTAVAGTIVVTGGLATAAAGTVAGAGAATASTLACSAATGIVPLTGAIGVGAGTGSVLVGVSTLGATTTVLGVTTTTGAIVSASAIGASTATGLATTAAGTGILATSAGFVLGAIETFSAFVGGLALLIPGP